MGFADFVGGVAADRLARDKARELQKAENRKTNKMRQYEYEVARKSILGDFSSFPISSCHECIANFKALRRQTRLDLVNRAIASCPKHAKEAIRLRQDMDEVENMRCAKHVYLANDPNAPADLRDNPPPGFKKATPKQLKAMGLKERMLRPKGSNFRAAVYIKDPAVWGPDPRPGAVIAFRGSTPATEDWENNFAQNCDMESDYYRNAVHIGNRLASSNADVYIVGHSLGGGLASAAQGGSGLPASTYNAAGLHPNTVRRYSEDSRHLAAEPDKISAIRIKGEVLTKTQENLIGSNGLSSGANDAVGVTRDLGPSHDKHHFEDLKKEKKILNNDAYDTYLHGMDEVIDSTEAQKRVDEAVLRTCIGGG